MNDVVQRLPSGAWSLLGPELWGSGPLGHVRLPLVPDRISVLFGLNGAGKSTVLTAVRSALRGTCDESLFLERFRTQAELQVPHRDDRLTTFVRRALSRRSRGMRIGPGSDVPERPHFRSQTLPPVTEALQTHFSPAVTSAVTPW